MPKLDHIVFYMDVEAYDLDCYGPMTEKQANRMCQLNNYNPRYSTIKLNEVPEDVRRELDEVEE